MTVNGNILTNGTISYSYTTLPTLSSTSLGYTINYTNATTTVTGGTYYNSPAISVTPGIYIVQGYALFTPSSTAIYLIRLGINTTTGAFSNTYNYASEVKVANTNAVSINYTTYLSVATTTNFYFVFFVGTGNSGNLNGSLNGKFIRIA